MKRLYISMNQTESRLYRGLPSFVSLAESFGAEIVAVFVVDKESLLKLERYKIFVSDEVAHLSESLSQEGEKRCQKLQNLCEERGIKMYTIILEGEPLHDFLRYVTEDPCEEKLIGVVRRGCGAMFRDIFDPLSRQILLETPYDVFVVGVQDHERSH
ncbi:universal stress protein [Thermospira aquatica]|uniref:Universal stress protein n=1 Tax=Thermospira aquatica TaxID=2828656 RepID=A0AAX3BCW0_9SPIR|nr:universal stress protein [Thermospira aquatica]URA10118.1 universal stress protein [Thermospira aquatica]